MKDRLVRIARYLLVGLRIIRRPRFVIRVRTTQPAAKELGVDEIVAVVAGDETKWLCFLCPCGSGEIVRLAVSSTRRPAWTYTADRLARPTIHPSIWQLDGCRCHFWVKRGEIDWCSDSGSHF
jgi:hypothetical protein